MCIQCHNGFSNEYITEELANSLNIITEKPESFEDFSPSSISHLAYASIGVNGEKARLIAHEIFNKYFIWRCKRNDTRDYSLWYNIKHQLYLSFYSRTEQIIDHFGKFEPDELSFIRYFLNIKSIDRKTFNNGKYADIGDEEFSKVFYKDDNIFADFSKAMREGVGTLDNVIEKPMISRNIIIIFGCIVGASIGIGIGVITEWLVG
jgi:hypothetical protein